MGKNVIAAEILTKITSIHIGWAFALDAVWSTGYGVLICALGIGGIREKKPMPKYRYMLELDLIVDEFIKVDWVD